MPEIEIEDFDFEDAILLILFTLPFFMFNWFRRKSSQEEREYRKPADAVDFSQPSYSYAREELHYNYDNESRSSSR